jgi:hypothetical protein
MLKILKNDKIDDLITYDKKKNKYNLITKTLIIEGNSIDDVKNKLDEGYNKLSQDIEDLNNQKIILKQEKDNFQELVDLQKEAIKNKELKLNLKEKELSK